MKAIIAISIGAALGALLRWVLGLKLNSILPEFPQGTLAANLVGGYVIGVAIAYFSTEPNVPGEWRLFIITGFCGALTTFSTFSAEIVTLLQQGRAAMAGGLVAAHVIGSVTMTFLGIASHAWVNANWTTENSLQGAQLTFFIQQDRQHHGKPLAHWLVEEARAMGIRGATLVPASEGFGYHRRIHSAHFVELADQPLSVIMVVTGDESDRIFAKLGEEKISVVYSKTPIEFGITGEEE